MAHTIERAKSGRAVCKTCQEAIAQGELRLGEEVPNAFSGRPGVRWHHLRCAAESRPAQLREALAGFRGDIPDRAALEAQAELALGELPPVEFPFAERAHHIDACRACGEPIAAGELCVAVEEREDFGSYVRLAAAHLHPGCLQRGGLGHDDEALIRTHSRGVSPADLDAIARELAAPA